MSNSMPKTNSLKESWAAKRKTLTPRAIEMSGEALVKLSQSKFGRPLPLVVEPNVSDISLPIWVGYNLEFIETNLTRYGGILFRGFYPSPHSGFEQFLEAFPTKPMYYMEGATPRTQLSDRVYTSTEYPADRTISLHNELCYVMTWPMKIWFHCTKPSDEGGETSIGDVRRVFTRIRSKTRQRFIEKGWMLVRNFGDGLGINWQTSFRIKEKTALEEYFQRAQIEFQWKDNDRLRTRQVRPAVAKHPKSGEMLWFNHACFWNVWSLEPSMREMFLQEFGEEGLPYNTYYGDGSPIEASVINEISEAYEREKIAFPWQTGDILMLDNMLVAHGRNPFVGDRKVLVAMGDPNSDRCI
jgi:alpha-ketoglutarate-dependent taurine dioxygenase